MSNSLISSSLFFNESLMITPQDQELLDKAGEWVVAFLNSLGGDFRILMSDSGQTYITNHTRCPCFRGEVRTTSLCDSTEVIVSKTLQVLDRRLKFVNNKCTNCNDSCCEFVLFIQSAFL